MFIVLYSTPFSSSVTALCHTKNGATHFLSRLDCIFMAKKGTNNPVILFSFGTMFSLEREDWRPEDARRRGRIQCKPFRPRIVVFLRCYASNSLMMPTYFTLILTIILFYLDLLIPEQIAKLIDQRSHLLELRDRGGADTRISSLSDYLETRYR